LDVDGEKALCKLVVDWLETSVHDVPVDRLSENVIAAYRMNLYI